MPVAGGTTSGFLTVWLRRSNTRASVLHHTQTVLVELALTDGTAASLPADAMASAPRLSVEFPTVQLRHSAAPPHVVASVWHHPDFDPWPFDVSIDELARDSFTLRVDTPAFALAALTRCQRHVGRRNAHSGTPLFTRILDAHRALHDVDKPLVRADYNHALDVWQWLLRLDPDASPETQISALFHDIERLASESEARIEHLAPDYQQFKDAHAHKGAEIASAVLAANGVDVQTRMRVAALVARHERPSDDPELALLNDADALSFFSLNSPGYASYFGPEQTRKKVAYTWNRMTPRARAKLDGVWLKNEVRTFLEELKEV